MKTKFLFGFLFLLLSFSLVSSVDISVKEEFKLGENFVMKVSGSFYIQPTKSDVKFFRDSQSTSFGVVKMEKIEGDYYFFLEVPLEKEPGNYTVVLEDLEYYSGRDVVTGDISASFVILDEVVPFSISPPLLITSEDYDIEIQNLMDSKIDISLEKSSKPVDETGETVDSESFLDALFNIFTPENDSESVDSVDENIIIEEPTSGSVITLKSGEIKTLHELAPEKKGFQVLEFYYGNEAYGTMIYSSEGKPRSEIVIDDEEEAVVPEVNESEEEVDLKKEAEDKLAEKGIDEDTVIVTENGTVLDKETNNPLDLNLPTCAELNGSSCGLKAKCSGDERLTLDAQCCLATCEVIQKSSTGKVIGWFIIAIIAIFLTWFFKQKYKKAGPGKIDILKESKPKELRA